MDIKIYEGFSLINSEILFKKNDLPYSQNLVLDNFIELNGANLETINFSVLMDNQPRPGSNINNASFTSYAQPLFADAKKYFLYI